MIRSAAADAAVARAAGARPGSAEEATGSFKLPSLAPEPLPAKRKRPMAWFALLAIALLVALLIWWLAL